MIQRGRAWPETGEEARRVLVGRDDGGPSAARHDCASPPERVAAGDHRPRARGDQGRASHNVSTLAGSSLEGADHGATISLILDRSGPGHGPRLHRHPYDDTWVVQEGSLTFHLGDERVTGAPGDIVIVAPGVPHRFTNDGPGRPTSSASTPTPRWSRSGWSELRERPMPVMSRPTMRLERLLEPLVQLQRGDVGGQLGDELLLPGAAVVNLEAVRLDVVG